MRGLPRHLILWPALACATLALLVITAFVVAWTTAPSITDLQARVRTLDEASGAHPVSLHRVAPVMREATVATEDERFYSHDGVDVIGVLRALPYDVSHLSLAEGASTITEQLAKLVYLGGNDHSPWGKLRDAAIALRIEAAYPKERILADYLNTVYFGAGAYGVQAASERYFSIPGPFEACSRHPATFAGGPLFSGAASATGEGEHPCPQGSCAGGRPLR